MQTPHTRCRQLSNLFMISFLLLIYNDDDSASCNSRACLNPYFLYRTIVISPGCGHWTGQ